MLRSRRDLREIRDALTKLETLLIVRDPGNHVSADAYEGLRKTITHAAQARRSHISHLMSLKDSLDRGADIDLLRDRVGDFLQELGIEFSGDTRHAELFEIEGPQRGGELECVRPAVVQVNDRGERTLYRPGLARWSGPTGASQTDPGGDEHSSGPVDAAGPAPGSSPEDPEADMSDTVSTDADEVSSAAVADGGETDGDIDGEQR